MLLKALQEALASSTHFNELSKIMEYAVFPSGKMFRPRLVEALGLDLGDISKHHKHLASAIELHHAYTLVHDDLPAMDNDLIRRGKPSTHAQFGEWKAILAGDALLIASMQEINKIKNTEITNLFTWATGAKGLILGQFLDLGANGKATLSEIIRIHELKTSRLIQVATLGSLYLSEKKPSLKKQIEFMRLGRDIGVSFQLMDDLNELQGEISPHEKEINPFLFAPDAAKKELNRSTERLQSIVKKYQLKNTETMLSDYFKKI